MACKNSHQIFIIKFAPPSVRGIAIWKRNGANTESAAVRKSEEDHCRAYRIKKKRSVTGEKQEFKNLWASVLSSNLFGSHKK